MSMPALRPILSPKNGATPTGTQSARVLVLDEDDKFHRSLLPHLADCGFDPVACSGQAALDFVAKGESADAIVMDGHTPDANSLRVLRDLRQRGVMPVIFLTETADEVRVNGEGLDSEPADLIHKPRQPSGLARRIQLIVEAVRGIPEHQEKPQSFRVGSLELRFDIKRARWAGEPIEFTISEFHVVSHLATKLGEDVSYRELYDIVRGRGFLAGQGIDGHRTNVRSLIKRIRRKFREVHPSFDQIQNYAGFGYRWITD
jgi:two-component system, OmpR family, response regulator ChvI